MNNEPIITQADISMALIRARQERSQEFHRIIKKIFVGMKTKGERKDAPIHAATAKFGA